VIAKCLERRGRLAFPPSKPIIPVKKNQPTGWYLSCSRQEEHRKLQNIYIVGNKPTGKRATFQVHATYVGKLEELNERILKEYPDIFGGDLVIPQILPDYEPNTSEIRSLSTDRV